MFAMRNLILLVFLAIALAVVMRLLTGVIRSVAQLLGLAETGQDKGTAKTAGHKGPNGGVGHFVRDPQSGTYVDEKLAVKEVIGGQTFYFESKETRDAYLRKARS
jgi:hypothetical protein